MSRERRASRVGVGTVRTLTMLLGVTALLLAAVLVGCEQTAPSSGAPVGAPAATQSPPTPHLVHDDGSAARRAEHSRLDALVTAAQGRLPAAEARVAAAQQDLTIEEPTYAVAEYALRMAQQNLSAVQAEAAAAAAQADLYRRHGTLTPPASEVSRDAAVDGATTVVDAGAIPRIYRGLSSTQLDRLCFRAVRACDACESRAGTQRENCGSRCEGIRETCENRAGGRPHARLACSEAEGNCSRQCWVRKEAACAHVNEVHTTVCAAYYVRLREEAAEEATEEARGR